MSAAIPIDASVGFARPGPEAGVSHLRSRAQQARSRARFASLLAAAERVLVAEGAEAVTTTRVAAEAKVSIGTFYHYLPDREAILHALALTYLEGFERRMEAFIAVTENEAIPDIAGTIIDAYAIAYRSSPGLRTLWFGGGWQPATLAADRAHKEKMGRSLHEVLLSQGVDNDDRLATTCHAAVLMADAVIQEAFRREPEGDVHLLAELKFMFRSWFSARSGLTPGVST